MLLIADTTVISNFAYANRLEDLQIGFSNIFNEILKMDEDEMNTFTRLCSKFGRGEASCLAIALHRNAGILTDDLDARRFAQQGSISVSGSVGILIKAIDLGQLSREQGNHLLHLMIAKGYYSPIETLDEFLS